MWRKAESESFDCIVASDSIQKSHNAPGEIESGSVESKSSIYSDREESSECGSSELRTTAKRGIVLPPHLQTKQLDCAAAATVYRYTIHGKDKASHRL